MNKTLPKRGRPPKGGDRVKADYLDIRLLATEKQAFRDAVDQHIEWCKKHGKKFEVPFQQSTDVK